MTKLVITVHYFCHAIYNTCPRPKVCYLLSMDSRAFSPSQTLCCTMQWPRIQMKKNHLLPLWRSTLLCQPIIFKFHDQACDDHYHHKYGIDQAKHLSLGPSGHSQPHTHTHTHTIPAFSPLLLPLSGHVGGWNGPTCCRSKGAAICVPVVVSTGSCVRGSTSPVTCSWVPAMLPPTSPVPTGAV